MMQQKTVRIIFFIIAAAVAAGGFVCRSEMYDLPWPEPRVELLPSAKAKAGRSLTLHLPHDEEAPTCNWTFEADLRIGGNHHGGGMNGKSWRVELIDSQGESCGCFTLTYNTVALQNSLDEKRVIMASFTSDNAPAAAPNMLTNTDEIYGHRQVVTIVKHGDECSLYVGRDGGVFAAAGIVAAPVAALRLSADKKLLLTDAVVRFEPVAESLLATGAALADNGERGCTSENADVVEPEHCSYATPVGEWHFLDRDTDSNWAEPGGRYTLQVVPFGSVKLSPALDDAFARSGTLPAYLLLYIDGAEANAANWHRGMVKGALYATVYENHYDAMWFDSFFEPEAREVSADFFPLANILVINIPLYKAVIRFSRIPQS